MLTIGLLLGTFLLPIISQAEELTGLENLKMLGEYYDSDRGDITPVVNPAGKVRVMVFYQYQCADCAKSLLLNSKINCDLQKNQLLMIK